MFALSAEKSLRLPRNLKWTKSIPDQQRLDRKPKLFLIKTEYGIILVILL